MPNIVRKLRSLCAAMELAVCRKTSWMFNVSSLLYVGHQRGKTVSVAGYL